MPELPTGAITFLFTDIEGSTELAGSYGKLYPALLERHNRLLRDAITAEGGIEVATEGDAFFVVFTSPTAAVRAAATAQRALQGETWPDAADLRVRMGLHTGEAVIGGDNYVGLDVHRASRVAAAGHGGQILLSDPTRALVEPSLPEGAALRDLGEHRLKGLPRSERIFQLSLEGLPSGFPPLRSLEVRANNLPAEVTTFIGRERQVREVGEFLSAARLLTLTGPGGTGKTRLAIRVAEEALGWYEHGCWFVGLEALRDPELLPSNVASALGVRSGGSQPVMAALTAWLADRELLLVLDNFEQVIAAAPQVAELLDAGPRLRVLATSRTPLHLYGEREYPVPPLGMATETGEARTATAESLSQYEAVQLFIERAVALKPGFRLTNANAPAVAEICARLDGLPLAIELAAARVKLLSPEQMLARLQQSLSLLATSAQDLPERQRTLLGAIDWSHNLLGEPERRLFARCSIFRGGFSLEAAEQVCADGELGIDVFDGLASLVDESLLRSEALATETRFSMLETIRDYARARLIDAGELEALARRHGRYFFALGIETERPLGGPHQLEWLERLEREHDNLRAAFSRAAEMGMLDDALLAAGAIWRFWQLRGHLAEARSTFDGLLPQPDATERARAKALGGAGGTAYWQGDYQAMARFYREARELYESVGDQAGLADALYNESFVPVLLEGDLDAARTLLERAAELYRQSDNELGLAEAETMIGFGHYFRGDPAAAIPYQERAVELYRAAGAAWQVSDNLLGLSWLYAQLGDWGRASALKRESLGLAQELGIEVGVAMILEAVGSAAAWVGDTERGVRLLGKADAMQERLGGSAPSQFIQSEPQRDKAHRELGDERFEQLLAEGAALQLEEAVALADEFNPPPDAPPMPKAQPWGRAAESPIPM